MQDLGTLVGEPNYNSFAVAINASGQVAGNSMTLPERVCARVLLGRASMRDLGTLGGRESHATAMNDSGEVAGNSDVSIGVSHAFFWDGATMRDLGTLGGARSEARDMNASGHVVGVSSTASVVQLTPPFLWDGTTMRDLNTLVDPGDPLKPYVTLYYARRINDRGDIAAEGIDSRRPGNSHLPDVSCHVDGRPGGIRPAGGPGTDAQPDRPGPCGPAQVPRDHGSGTPVTDVTGSISRCERRVVGALARLARPVERYAKQRKGLQNLGGGRYQYNWKSAGEAKGCRVVSLGLPSEYNASALSAHFQLSN